MTRLFSFVISGTVFISSAFAAFICEAGAPGQSPAAETAIAAQEPPASQIKLSKLTRTEVQSEVLRWLKLADASPEIVQKVESTWAATGSNDESGDDLLEQVIQAFALKDSATAEFLIQMQNFSQASIPVTAAFHKDPFYVQCIQLYYGRWLAQHRFYDEALENLNSVEPDGSIDPAGVLFYRAVCQKALLDRESALSSLTLLLNHVVDVPPRFRTLAEIMQNELNNQTDEGLGEVSRVMSDVQRRLDLGRSGQKVQDQEQQVISLLDKLLEEMEKQNQQSSSDGGGQGGNSQNQSPQQGAEQSTIKGNPADGEADRKEVTENGAWGMLNKQAEAQARELIRQQFPSNYLDAISRYTKKIAERK